VPSIEEGNSQWNGSQNLSGHRNVKHKKIPKPLQIIKA
jgi:hypothetical protein